MGLSDLPENNKSQQAPGGATAAARCSDDRATLPAAGRRSVAAIALHLSPGPELAPANCDKKKTEPPDLSQAAPPSFGAHSLSWEMSGCQQDTKTRAENGEPGLAKPPRLPSVPFAPTEPPRLNVPDNALLGSTATYPTPPSTGKDLILSAFRLLNPMHKLYLDDFKSDQPILNHGSSGWPHRAAFCYHAAIPGSVGVELRRHEDKDHHVHAGLGGVEHCGDIWKCPVCALYSALRWQGDTIAAEQALRAEGYRLLLCVLTVSHDEGTTLAEEIEILRNAYTELFQQRKKSQKKRAARWGIVGRMRAWDVLYGENGWHAHMNVIIAVGPDVRDYELEKIHDDLDRTYRQAVANAGGFASCDHGLKITEYKNEKAYSVKTGLEGLESRQVGDKFALGYELVSTDQKVQHGLSIGALRLATVAGYQREGLVITPARAGELCLEYAATMQGERSVISAGVIREKLKQVGKAEESSEQENSAPPIAEYEIVGVIPTPDYHREIVGKDRFVDLLIAVKAGPADLAAFLAGVGIVLEARNISLQFNVWDSVSYADDKAKRNVIKSLKRGALIRQSGDREEVPGKPYEDIDSRDLDEFL